MKISYPTLITATTLALMTACAAPTTPQASATNAQTESATATPAATPAIFKEGTVAEFGKTETTLDKADIANISKNIDAFKQAKLIEITGYCDRKDNLLGAQQVGLARASAVQVELVKQGVPAKKIHLKYGTSEARHSASVVLK